MICRDCKIDMISGYRVDYNNSVVYRESWRPISSKSFLEKIPILSIIVNNPKKNIEVTTFCCPKCGLLESKADLNQTKA